MVPSYSRDRRTSIYRNEPANRARSKKRGHPPISRMEDSTADDSRNLKRARRLAPPPGDVVDRISGLDDEVLLHILELVPDARDAVRTGALSRRRLGLWTRVPELRFASRSASTADLERFVSFVNGVLARRSQSDCAIESLAISSAAHYSTAWKTGCQGLRLPGKG